MFSLSGKVLEWFRSYLEQCSQRVSVHGILFDVQLLLSDVYHRVQFLVIWFSQCILVLLGSLRSDWFGVKYYLYADDTQLYISLYPDNELTLSSPLKNLEHCIADNRLWILNLNDNKTNIIYLASHILLNG